MATIYENTVSLVIRNDGSTYVRESKPGGGTAMDIWHGRHVTVQMPSPCTSDLVAVFVKENEDEIAEVASGIKIVWDGSNSVGQMTDETLDALQALRSEAEMLEPDVSIWEASDWLANNDLGVSDDSTDAQIEALTATLYEDAERDGVVVRGLEKYLQALRA